MDALGITAPTTPSETATAIEILTEGLSRIALPVQLAFILGCASSVRATKAIRKSVSASWWSKPAPLAIVACLAGLGVAVLGGGAIWFVAAVLIGSVVPLTLIGIAPTNRRLLAPGRDPGSDETRALLERWGKLHAVRTVLSLIAVVIMMWQLVAA